KLAPLFFRVDHLPPGMIGIEGGHLRGDAGCAIAKVPFVDVAIIVDDEGHDAGVAVFRRIGDGGKATDHVAVDDVIHGPTWRGRALAQQDLEAIAVEWFAGARPIALLRCRSDGLTQRARLLISARRPIESVLLAGRTDNLLRIDGLAALALVHV